MKKKLMSAIIMVVLVISFGVIIDVAPGYAETIYTKTGREIKATVTEITDDTIWYEVTVGDMVECVGIDTEDVKKIENDDGTAYVDGLDG